MLPGGRGWALGPVQVGETAELDGPIRCDDRGIVTVTTRTDAPPPLDEATPNRPDGVPPDQDGRPGADRVKRARWIVTAGFAAAGCAVVIHQLSGTFGVDFFHDEN
jgi:hypothetical protein